MKRSIALILTAVMLILCGCSSEGSSETSSKNRIFTDEQAINKVTFALPVGTIARPANDEQNSWIYLWGKHSFLVMCQDQTFDLKQLADSDFMGAGDYDFLTIGDTDAMHFEHTQDDTYLCTVTFNHLGNNYLFSCTSTVSAEIAREYYEELLETIELQPASYTPPQMTTAAPAVTTTTTVSEPEPSFSKFSLNGSGSKVIRDVTLPPVTCIVRAEHNGRSNFIAHHLSNNGDTSYVANELGVADSYQVFTPRRYSSTDGVLDVDADGDWRITFIPLEEYFTGGDRTSFSGRGNSVAGCFTASGMTFLKGTHSGSSNFIVHVYEYSGGDSRLYAFNEIGQYSGDAVIRTQAGKKYFFDIKADGYWTIEIDD